MAVVSSLCGADRRLDNFIEDAAVEFWLQKQWRAKQARDFSHSRRRVRMVWEDRIASLTTNEFKRTYRMSLEVFNFVLERIRHRLTGKAAKKARKDTHGPVPPELLLSMALRFLAGGSYLDIYQMHGVGQSTMFHAIPMVCHAIATEFPLEFPIDDEDALSEIASQFDKVGQGLLTRCVGALDGIALKIKRPSMNDVGNPKQFFNRKGFHALVLQVPWN
jgi:hypothetical protein